VGNQAFQGTRFTGFRCNPDAALIARYRSAHRTFVLQPMPLKQTIQLPAMNPQNPGCPRLVPVLLPQNLDNMGFLQVLQPTRQTTAFRCCRYPSGSASLRR
jgi:hypothetical protein